MKLVSPSSKSESFSKVFDNIAFENVTATLLFRQNLSSPHQVHAFADTHDSFGNTSEMTKTSLGMDNARSKVEELVFRKW